MRHGISSIRAQAASKPAPSWASQLWKAIVGERDIKGAANLAILQQAAKALDCAEQYATIIAQDGPVIQTKSGARDHPLIRHQISSRALCCRLLVRLGIVDTPKRPVGRPPVGGPGIRYDQLEAMGLGSNE